MKTFFALWLTFIWNACSVVCGAENSPLNDLYDRQTLTSAKSRLSEKVEFLFSKAVQPQLLPQEKLVLAGVRFEFPLYGANGGPMDFYSDPEVRIVFMPILPLMFHEDICTAYAWLQVNGYRLETVEEYVSMLKYKKPTDFGPGGFPPPLKGLKIPADALKDPKVDSLSLKLRNSTYAFILSHELGHILHRHPGYRGVPRPQARSNELEADRFGLEMLRRNGEVPMGGMMFFQTSVYYFLNRADVPEAKTDEQWNAYLDKSATHPLNATRLLALAERVASLADDYARRDANPVAAAAGVRFIGTNLVTFANFLDNVDLQKVMRVKIEKSSPASLVPRKTAQTLSDFPLK